MEQTNSTIKNRNIYLHDPPLVTGSPPLFYNPRSGVQPGEQSEKKLNKFRGNRFVLSSLGWLNVANLIKVKEPICTIFYTVRPNQVQVKLLEPVNHQANPKHRKIRDSIREL